MNLLNTLERRVFFSLTRLFALLVISMLVFALCGAVIYMALAQHGGPNKSVTPAEVVASIRAELPKEPGVEGASSVSDAPVHQLLLPGVKLPFVLQRHFSNPGNIRTLNKWLKALPAKEWQVFLDELSGAVADAEKQSLSVDDAVHTYRRLKQDRMEKADVDDAARQAMQLKAAGVAAGALALIANFSLILVLLAIERNTRIVPEA